MSHAAVLLACLLTVVNVSAADPLPADAVARVGGTVITVRHLTQELLRREGADMVLQWVQNHLEGIDWKALGDDDVVMAVAGHSLRKRDLMLLVLKEKAGKVRDELIDIAIVEQALIAENVRVDDAAMASEYRMMERSFQRRMKESGPGFIDFKSYLRVKEKLTVEQFLAQPAVRMLAGVHQLVRKRTRAAWDDSKLQVKLDSERSRWDQQAAVDLSIIHLPFQRDAKGGVTPEEQAGKQIVANSLFGSIVTKETTFAVTWNNFGKSWDSSGPDGRVGWVDRDGRRDDENTRRIPDKLLERAFKSRGPFPALLPPCMHDAGVDIALVHGQREARTVTLAEVRERLLDDVFVQDLEDRTKACVTELRRAAAPAIEFASMPEVLRNFQPQAPTK